MRFGYSECFGIINATGEVADRLWARLAMDTLQQSVRVCVSAQHSNLATFWHCVRQAGFTEVSSWGCHVYKGGGPLQWARITDDSDGTSGGDRRPIHVLLTTRYYCSVFSSRDTK